MSGPASPSLAPGSRLGDLLLVRELGRGNQGVVFEAQQVSLGRSVAVKILPSEITRVEEQIDRFHREAEAAARLTHPNIVAVYGFDDTLGYPLIVQELVTGGSLEKVLAGRAERKEGTNVAACQWAAQTCRQLAEALEHAHQHNVIHRDIKPGNVLLTTDGVPKIADFGLAKVSDLMDLSHTGTIMGTPHYMSPEQVSGRREALDARTDVYALGALLYRMLTHEVPFSADSLQRMFNDILTREPRPPRKLQPGVHPDLEAVCLKALEKSPDRRYASAQEMAADLARFLRGETTVARPVGALGQLQRRLGRQSMLALVVLSLLVPTAWLATDVLLRRDAAEHVSRHDARAIVAVIAGLLLAFPLAQLGTRLARGRAVGAAAGLGLALLLGAGGSLLAIDQKTTQLHHTARGELEGRLELETAGSRADLSDLDQYVASWESRFDRDDLLLLTLGCLKRERPVQASQWAERLSSADAGADTPVEDALHAAIASALGDEAAATAAEARVRAAEGVERDWHVWARIGDILFDMQRDTEARASYERAARLPGADRDQLNLDLARVSVGLCEWDQAADVLQDVMKWQPDNPIALQLAIGIALHGDDWSGAGALVDRYEGNPAVGPVGRLSQRFVLLTDSGRRDEASRLVSDARAGQGDDPLVREWCARRAIDLGREENGLAAAARANDDAAGVERHGEAAVAWFESSRADYEALTQAPGDSLIGRVGLSAALIRLVPYHADQAAALYDEAAAHARRAIELDPYYWQAHYNLGVALLSRALLDAANDESAVPAERWQAVSEALVRSVQVNGLQQPVLNDAAHALAMQCRAAGSNERLPEALGLVRRAIALGERAAEGSCTPGALDRMRLSSCWDTLSEVQEQSGDVPAALESARSALAALGPDDPGRTKRAARIARLEQQPPATR